MPVILLCALVAAAQPRTPRRTVHQAVLDHVIQAYAAVPGYQVELFITNATKPRLSDINAPTTENFEQETLSVAYSAPDHYRLERSGDSEAQILGGQGSPAGIGGQYPGKALSKAGLTVYATIEDDLLQTRVLQNQNVTVDSVSLPCVVIQATYHARPDPNRPRFFVDKRTFWVDTKRYVVLREVDLSRDGGVSQGETEFMHTIMVRKLVWDQRPPDTLFDDLAPAGMPRSSGAVPPAPDGITPAVPIAEGCHNITDPAALIAWAMDAQTHSCRNLPLTPEVRTAGLRGAVELQYDIDTDGKPVDIRVMRPLGLGLDEQAVECVSHWRFRPAQHDGKPFAIHNAVVEIPMGVDSGPVWPFWRLARAEFRPPTNASRPVFSKAGYHPGFGYLDQISGVVGFVQFHVRLTIGKDGVPRDVEVLPRVDPRLDKQAVQIVSKWRFKPGMQNGVPVEVPASFDLGLGQDPRTTGQDGPVVR